MLLYVSMQSHPYQASSTISYLHTLTFSLPYVVFSDLDSLRLQWKDSLCSPTLENSDTMIENSKSHHVLLSHLDVDCILQVLCAMLQSALVSITPGINLSVSSSHVALASQLLALALCIAYTSMHCIHSFYLSTHIL